LQKILNNFTALNFLIKIDEVEEEKRIKFVSPQECLQLVGQLDKLLLAKFRCSFVTAVLLQANLIAQQPKEICFHRVSSYMAGTGLEKKFPLCYYLRPGDAITVTA
jgi:hypothetical protein